MMRFLPHTIWDRVLVAYATGRLPRFLARRVAARLAHDVELAAAYDALMRAERVAGGTPLTSSQRERLASAILDSVTSTSTSTSTSASTSTADSLARRLLGRGAPFAVVGAAAAVLFVVVREPESGGLTPRGDHGQRELVGVKATCLSPDGARIVDTATVGAVRHADRLDCPGGSLIAFSTTNTGSVDRHVFVVGVTASGERRWYSPFGESSSVRVPAGAADDVLSPVADTRGMSAEPVTLHVLISDEPFSAREVERQLATAVERGMSVGRADRLPVDVRVQARIDLSPSMP